MAKKGNAEVTKSENAILQAKGLSKKFGSLQVTNNVNLSLMPGARMGLIGPNGAGKTTLVNLLTGVVRADSGSIIVDGREVTNLSPERRVKKGLVRTHQISTLIGGYTALENVAMGIAEREGIAWRMFGYGPKWHRCLDEALDHLRNLHLAVFADQIVSQMPYGAQRLLEIAIALAMKPRVLLLDEPAAGVPITETLLIEEVLNQLPKDIAILIIDHDVDLILRFAKEVTVLAQGQILMQGAPDEVAASPAVRAVYLGRATP